MAPVTEVPLSHASAISSHVRISLSRIDDHLARAIVIFALLRGIFLLRLLLLLLFLPARPAVSSRKHKLKVSALPDLLDTYSASSQVSQHDTRGRRYRADEEKVTQGVSEASPSASSVVPWGPRWFEPRTTPYYSGFDWHLMTRDGASFQAPAASCYQKLEARQIRNHHVAYP